MPGSVTAVNIMSDPILPPVPTPADPQPDPPAQPPAPRQTQAPVPTPPPAARTVITGEKSEREIALEQRLKLTENRVNVLEDETSTLKTVPKLPDPQPQPKKKDFLEGLTFFEDDDE